jgi:hypothetical protein
MSVADNIRALASAAEPSIEAWLEAADEIAELAAAARDNGINWSALKALLVAKAKDAKDGGERLAKMTAKADVSLTYAGMLELPIVAKENKTSPQSPTASKGEGASGAPRRKIPGKFRENSAAAPPHAEPATNGEPALANAPVLQELPADVGAPAGSPTLSPSSLSGDEPAGVPSSLPDGDPNRTAAGSTSLPSPLGGEGGSDGQVDELGFLLPGPASPKSAQNIPENIPETEKDPANTDDLDITKQPWNRQIGGGRERVQREVRP